ncbi:uncharacterized protein [Halyomorpha halys]|nr:uncharacterized protein LOC106684537 isoform X3 [Halyomorpha halys]
MWAVRLKHREMAKLLIKRGANLNMADNEGNTALMTAASTKSWTQDLFLDIWNIIKDSGFNINHSNKTGNTILHCAVKRNWPVVVDLITMDGANPNLATNKGVTPIMMACSRHQVNIIETLLAHSADLSLEDQKGCTACCYAIAYMIQKRIVTLEFAIEEMISYMRTDNSKMSVKCYLKRRLELLLNPPEENFSKTIFSVIIHIITFFLRFVVEGITVLLHLNVFKTLRNAIEKHIKDNDYIVALLKILAEIVRYCECCTPHITWDNVAAAFNEAGIPCVCLRLQKRLGNSPSLHATFLPLFLTCKHPMTKLWLQKNFKPLSHYYRQYIQIQVVQSEYNFYPNEAHSQMVRKCSLHFKQLIGQLQRGNIIQQEQKQTKKKKEKLLDKKNNLQHNVSFFKKSSSESDKLSIIKSEENKKQSNKEENIIVAVISNKKKEERTINAEDPKVSTEEETYWPLDKVNQGQNQIEEIVLEVEEEPEDLTVYPKWREEFREGCQLFGIHIENKIEKYDEEIENSDIIPLQVPLCTNKEVEIKISELDSLFDNVLNIFEASWQEDFIHGYEDVDSGIKDYLKLMYTLPNMEMYHWSEVTQKWKELCNTIRLKWPESGDKIIPDLKTFLQNFTEGLNEIQFMKTQDRENSFSAEQGIDERTNNSVISIEQFIRENQEEMHLKIKKYCNSTNDDDTNSTDFLCQSNEDETLDEVEICVPQELIRETSLPSTVKDNEPQIIEEFITNDSEVVHGQLAALKIGSINAQIENNDEICPEKDTMSNQKENEEIAVDSKIEEKASYTKCSETESLIIDKNLEEPVEIWMVAETFSSNFHSKTPFPPPGFAQLQISKLKEIYQQNWRQTEFVKKRYSKHITTLRCVRSILVKNIIMPPPHLQMHFLMGHGGSFGSVTLALDLNSGKPLVVKRLAQNGSIALRMRAWKIHSLMRRLLYVYSEFLVPFTHCVDTERFILLATPLCQRNINEHLALLKSTGCFTREKAVSLVQQTMAGLHYLHTQEPPIVHGNLKPTNLLLDALGNIRLADFGIHETIGGLHYLHPQEPPIVHSKLKPNNFLIDAAGNLRVADIGVHETTYQQLCTSVKAALWWSRETYWHYRIDWTVMATCSSDIQVLGMLSHYILTAGLHPFGRTAADIVRSLIQGTPILKLDNHEALDIISWMLSAVPEKRPTTTEIMKHVFHWDKNKRWKFLLVCGGILENITLTLVLGHFHKSIDKYASQHKINTNWDMLASKPLDSTISRTSYKQTISGLLCLLKDKHPSASWFLPTFPSLPFILCRLLEDSPWFSHPDLAQFRSLQF